MSASERLRELYARHERVIPLFGRVGQTEWKRDRDSESVMDALPEIVAVVEAAETARKIEASSSYTSIYSAPGEMAAPLRVALAALEEKLKP